MFDPASTVVVFSQILIRLFYPQAKNSLGNT